MVCCAALYKNSVLLKRRLLGLQSTLNGLGFKGDGRVFVAQGHKNMDTNCIASGQAMHDKPVSRLNGLSTRPDVSATLEQRNLLAGIGGLNKTNATHPGETFIDMVHRTEADGPPTRCVGDVKAIHICAVGRRAHLLSTRKQGKEKLKQFSRFVFNVLYWFLTTIGVFKKDKNNTSLGQLFVHCLLNFRQMSMQV